MLATYAVPTDGSAGRLFQQDRHAYRSEIQRDRARIIHCAAFRRLDGKTQVFLNGSGDHYRTRLTHTMEVASISRTIARALHLNEDLAESIALAHDLGHPPCGHTGEEALDRLVSQHGGFDHNAQSLRIVEMLEEKYPNHAGLNLTWDVREGLQKHALGFTDPASGESYTSPSLEAQVTDLADEIAYSSHDLDDGIDAGLLHIEGLRDVPLWAQAERAARAESPELDLRRYRGFVIRCLVNLLVDDLVAVTSDAIVREQITTLRDVRQQPKSLAAFSEPLRLHLAQLRAYLFEHLYHHPSVAEANHRAAAMIADLYTYFHANPQSLGRKALARLESEGLERTICDHVSGMTDRYLHDQHQTFVVNNPKAG